MEEIVSLAKRRGFIYPTSEIYGGLANAYDYGPLGVELLRNIKNLWWKRFIHQRRDMVGIDSQIILHPKTWEASGHVGGFSDAVVEDEVSHKRYRADHLIEAWIKETREKFSTGKIADNNTNSFKILFKTVNNNTEKDNQNLLRVEKSMDYSVANLFLKLNNSFPDNDIPYRTELKSILDLVHKILLNYYHGDKHSDEELKNISVLINNVKRSNVRDKFCNDIIALGEYLVGWSTIVEDLTLDEQGVLITLHHIKSPEGNLVTLPKVFNLLMETHLGTLVGQKDIAYLRGETAQGIFSNFKNILDTTRSKLPVGVGQIGKSFRNEITLGQFVFRTFEFEQAEIEYFFNPKETNWEELMKDWKDAMWSFVTKDLGIKEENLRWRKHTDQERSHYSKDTYDLDYQFPFGWKELWGIAYRTDYDLNQHIKFSGADLRYTDPQTQEKYVPHVIEPAVGLNRMLLMVIADSMKVEEDRTVLKLPFNLAPYSVAVFPLVANKPDIIKTAEGVFDSIKDEFRTYWDDRSNIGKRYKYQDEMGTPFCITIDYQTNEDQTVTVRERDSMKQERIALDNLVSYLKSKLI